jgi:hypothetical protein
MESTNAVPPVSPVDPAATVHPTKPAVDVLLVADGITALAMVVYVNVTTLVPSPNLNTSAVVAPVTLAADPL